MLFTSAQQALHLLEVAERLQLAGELHRGLRRTVVASIGPTTSEMLAKLAIGVDFEPSHGKMGQLVSELSAVAHELVTRKRAVFDKLVGAHDSARW